MKKITRKRPIAKLRKTKKGEYFEIYVEVYFDRRTFPLVKTDIKIEKWEWDSEKGEVIENLSSFELNGKILKIIAEINELEFKCHTEGKIFTPSIIQEYFIKQMDELEEKMITFNSFIENEIKNEPSNNKKYIGQLRRTLYILNEFDHNITFEKLSLPSFARNWDAFLKKQESINSQNTIWKHHRNTKKFVNLAIKYKKISRDDDPYQNFISKKEQSQRLDLDFEELNRLWNTEMEHPRINKSRLVFLFGCFTGFRKSDIFNLEIAHFSRTIDGLSIDLDKIIKVKRPIKLPIELLFDGRAVEIIKQFLTEEEFKRLGYYNKEINRKVFQGLYDQKINTDLKIIQAHCNINKKLSLHVGRHTFGTNLAELTGDPYLIMELMGIGKMDTAMIYIHNSRERMNRKLRNVDWTPLKKGLENLRRNMY